MSPTPTSYTWGCMGEHNIVIASLPSGMYGTTSAAATVKSLLASLHHIKVGLLVGIGGAICRPNQNPDIRLGDVVVSQPDGTSGGVVQYDMGKVRPDGAYERIGSLNKPPLVLLSALGAMQAAHEIDDPLLPTYLRDMLAAKPRMTKGRPSYTHQGVDADKLFRSDYQHAQGERTCQRCDESAIIKRDARDSLDPVVHYGVIASGNNVIKDGVSRDALLKSIGKDCLCFEMEAAGLMDIFPCLVVRGICDYSDSHKNDAWQRYASTTAAACAKEIIRWLPQSGLKATQRLQDLIKPIQEGLKVVESNIDVVKYEFLFRPEGFKMVAISTDKMLRDYRTSLHDQATRSDQAQKRELLNWVSNVQNGAHHDILSEARTTGTCEWLLRTPEYNQWLESKVSRILWLYGSPGAGKSFLTSRVLDSLRSEQKREPSDIGLAYFYCDKYEEGRQKPVPILRSYVRQLLAVTDARSSIWTDMITLQETKRLRSSTLNLSDCSELLLRLVNLFTTPVIVLDALDECEMESRMEIVKVLDFLLRESKQPLRIFIASRPDHDIRAQYLKRSNIEILAENNQADIEAYVNEHVKEHGHWNSMSSALKTDVVRALLARSQGMFQWVSLQVRQILHCATEKDIRDRLTQLPKGLKAAYDEIYLKEKGSHGKALRDRAFAWVMCARIPMREPSLLSAIRLDRDVDNYSLDDPINGEQMLQLCDNLLVLDTKTRTWRFSHLSVAEYLTDNHLTLDEAHNYVAKACLKLLIGDYDWQQAVNSPGRAGPNGLDKPIDSQGSANANDDSRRRFQNADMEMNKSASQLSRHLRLYICQGYPNWAYHVRTQDKPNPDEHLSRLLKLFLGSPNLSSQMYQRWHGAFDIRRLYTKLNPSTLASLSMCLFSFYHLLADWWADQKQIDVLEKNKLGHSLLSLAASGGATPVCEELLKRGLPLLHDMEPSKRLNSRGFRNILPLSQAVHSPEPGSLTALELLLKAIKDSKILPSVIRINLSLSLSSLMHISMFSSTNLKLAKVIDSGACLCCIPLDHIRSGPLLFGMAACLPMVIAEILLPRALNHSLLARGKGYLWTLLLISFSRIWDLPRVKLLIELTQERIRGRKKETRIFKTGLSLALLQIAQMNYIGAEGIDMTLYLIDMGADVNFILQDNQPERWKRLLPYSPRGNLRAAPLSALVEAAYNGNRQMMDILIRAGAQVNLVPTQTSNSEYFDRVSGASALMAARDLDTIRYLVQNGADVNLTYPHGRSKSPLSAALFIGSEAVKFLLQQGARVNEPLLQGHGSALMIAAKKRDDATIGLLLTAGADINMPIDSHGSTSILEHFAFEAMSPTRGSFGWLRMPTSGAAEQILAIFRLLIESGASVRPSPPDVNNRYGSPWAAAARGFSFTHIEAEDTFRAVCEYFCKEQGVNINEKLPAGPFGSVLASAIAPRPNGVKAVKLLVELGANPDLRLENGKFGSALIAALARSPGKYRKAERFMWLARREIIQHLIDHGADINAILPAGDFGSALVAAAYLGWIGDVYKLVELGATINVSIPSSRWGTPLAAAIFAYRRKSRANKVKFLIRRGADVNMPIIIHTCKTRESCRGVLKLQPQKGTLRDVFPDGLPCIADSHLLLAMRLGYRKVIRILEEAGAKLLDDEDLAAASPGIKIRKLEDANLST